MRNLVVIGLHGILGLFLSMSALAQSPVKREILIEWHYVGHNGLKKLSNLKPLQQVLDLPETEALWNTACKKWSKSVAERYSKNQTADARTTDAIFSLIRDIALYESKFEFAAGQEPDWVLAVRLPADRHQQWSTNLWQMTSSARLGTPRATTSGWEVQGSDRPYNLRLTREKNWTIFGGGHLSADSQKPFIASLDDKDASGFVLKAKANLPQATKVWSYSPLLHAPSTSITVVPRGEELRTETQLAYREDLGITPEKWNVPLGAIRDPLVGFTAIQGLKKHLQENPQLKQFELEKIPNQAFIWSQAVSLFSIYAAADVGDPKKFIRSVRSALESPRGGLFEKLVPGQVTFNSTNHFLAWKGLPIAVPYLEPATNHPNFVVGGLFPLSHPSTNPAPAELFDQLNQPNLVFYEWEITAERLPQWRIFSQLAQMAQSKPIQAPEAPSEKWITAITPLLGNTITTITLESPRLLKMVRRSHSGFNALELVALAHALDNPPEIPKAGPAEQPPPLDNPTPKPGQP